MVFCTFRYKDKRKTLFFYKYHFFFLFCTRLHTRTFTYSSVFAHCVYCTSQYIYSTECLFCFLTAFSLSFFFLVLAVFCDSFFFFFFQKDWPKQPKIASVFFCVINKQVTEERKASQRLSALFFFFLTFLYREASTNCIYWSGLNCTHL